MVILEEATLGAGCFWCVEAVFEELDGVTSVVAGYAGGKTKNPSYEQVCSGTTGHAEVARITFDPRTITFAEILDVFWAAHDPTTLNRQGADVGDQYRSVIFYHDAAQKSAAEESRVKAGKWFSSPIVTQVEPLTEFYRAEDYHQDYFRNNPRAPYCMFVIKPKLEKLRLKQH
jgi:peptide-methionine (S)-S-oxide reductase